MRRTHEVTRKKRILSAIVILAGAVAIVLFANWFFSPFLLPDSNRERVLMAQVLEWYVDETDAPRDRPIYVANYSNTDAPRDFPQDDMQFWQQSGYGVRPASRLEPYGLGQVRDRLTKEKGHGVLFRSCRWTGRNAVDVDIVLRSGFCANGVTVALSHDLWGWRVRGSKLTGLR